MSRASELRQRVAREAAILLYFGAEKEYKQAKLKAAKVLGAHFLPSNLEVALELEKVSEEKEGAKRKECLIQMRQEALKMMKSLNPFRPVLIGSVWRGTIKQGSDIDIAVYADELKEVLATLKAEGVQVSKMARTTINKRGVTMASFHVYSQTPAGYELEIVIRNREEAGKRRKCEIFGDEIKGLDAVELEEVLSSNPSQRFVPS